MNQTGIPDYRAIKGNSGAYILRKIEGGTAHFYTLTFWDSFDSEDESFLLEFEPTVQHFEVFG